MKIKSIIIAVAIFAILASIPLFSFKDVKKISNKPVAIIVTEQIKEKEIKSISMPADVKLLYKF
jgi:hypothetical protein